MHHFDRLIPYRPVSRYNQPYEQHHAVDAKTPVVSVSQMLAAGLASVAAAAVTSRFGVAGTIIGAALTTMIITGGSAVLKSYLETIGGRLQNVPEKLRATRMRQYAGRGEQPAGPPADAPTQAVERDDGQKRGFLDKLRSSFEWFRGLPSSQKRSILLKAAIPMVLVFAIAIVAVTVAELLGGGTLSCMVWGECSGGPSTSFETLASGGGGGGGGLFDFGGGGAADEQYE